jgi:opacity protein-like surface antigen
MRLGGVARAQTAPAPQPSKGYAEVVAQSAFGSVTSQSFGGEIGVTVAPQLKVFLDIGQVRDASVSDLGASAQAIAGYLSQTQSAVAFRVKQPVTFGVAGVRYGFPLPSGRFEPYVLGGGGLARVQNDVSFSVGGSDVTSNLPQFGVALGTDLAGSQTKPMLTAGAGIAWPLVTRLIVDFQYRYGRVFADQAFNISRAGVGVGVRF